MDPIPQPGERWIVKIPETQGSETLSIFDMSSKPIIDKTFGIITLKLNKVNDVDS